MSMKHLLVSAATRTRRLAGVLLPAALLLLLGCEAVAQPVTVRFLCLAHLYPTIAPRPGDEAIRSFVSDANSGPGGPVLENTADELRDNPEFAGQVLGQRELISTAQAFNTSNPDARVLIRFIWPPMWDSTLKTEAGAGHVAVVQLGSSWLEAYEQDGLIRADDVVPYFYDCRLIYYWKSLVKPEQIATGASLLSTARRLRGKGLVPIEISTYRDYDLLWNHFSLAVNAGGELTRTASRAAWPPARWFTGRWTEAGINDSGGRKTVDWLTSLAAEGCLGLPEEPNVQLTQRFLADGGSTAMTLAEPWVGPMAEKQGIDWRKEIGAALPPSLDGRPRKTFIGGSVLAVLTGKKIPNAQLAAARKWMHFLAARGVENFIPASEESWKQWKYKELLYQAFGPRIDWTYFRDHLMGFPPEFPAAVERPDTRDGLYMLWKSIAATPRKNELTKTQYADYSRVRHEQVTQALASLADVVNEKLSPGSALYRYQWTFIAVLLVIAMLWGWDRWRLTRRLRDSRMQAEWEASRARLIKMELAELRSSASEDLEADAGRPADVE